MLNSEDLSEIETTLNIIRHIEDEASPSFLKAVPTARTNLSLFELLNIVSFILLSAKDIFYNKQGKPRSFIQLVASAGRIITFVRDLVRMINGKENRKQKHPAKPYLLDEDGKMPRMGKNNRTLKDDSQ